MSETPKVTIKEVMSEKELAEIVSELYMLNDDADEPDRTEPPSVTPVIH